MSDATLTSRDLLHTSLDLLKALVGFDTVSRHSNLELIEFVEAFLATHDVPCRRIANADGSKSNLLARIGPAVEGGVVLSGHTDVVPVDGQPWTSDPFTLTDKGDGRLYGRGSCDMKGFLACALAQVPRWQQLPLARPIYLAFSYDEEIGCLGAPSMIDRLMADEPRPNAVIIGEPTLMQPIVAQKGITTLRTTVTGKAAHSSQVNQGVSAIHVAARLVTRIEEIMAELVDEGAVEDVFNVPHSSLHVGRIEGGTAINIMARECHFEWEIRHLPNDGFETVFQRFEQFAKSLEAELRERAPEVLIVTAPLVETVPALADRDNAPALSLCRSLLDAPDAETGGVAYATEGGQFQRAGLPTVICGPGSIAQAHQPDEYIESDQLAAGDRFMQRLGDRLKS
ncbi:acetylornithine deacetylase [Salinicola rhizosphaerae]|uniref:Acetylornithine deacetylase n=1 Tax=Salinicola rhizosphaerae TaxID=1443141 RepID=A0ABQ3E6B4_9GAMM|nr:acetylornithine deacetylase [Salinicola rhizosphaerae]GHB23924.1 acetylornithine deacetylase [Salinicola rhizosphaerae]